MHELKTLTVIELSKQEKWRSKWHNTNCDRNWYVSDCSDRLVRKYPSNCQLMRQILGIRDTKSSSWASPSRCPRILGFRKVSSGGLKIKINTSSRRHGFCRLTCYFTFDPDPPRPLFFLWGKGYWKRRRSGKLFSFLVCQVGTKGRRRRRQLQVFLYKKARGVRGKYQLNICTLKMPKKAEKAKDKGADQVLKLVLTPGESSPPAPCPLWATPPW